ncbi:hypothetical protein LG200_06080 [Methylobacillus caricis]|uniref:hypothetical protein n=1 Tax=Methylobacillus caricis TaxID=1971611 RepID=UPI001CFF758C|nr:hypothetical protein [Methylobacillus caricis]MCB5187574.1 hypothetical protein [Methylobacillus caricis]
MIMILGKRDHKFNIVVTTSQYGAQKILSVDHSNVYGQFVSPEGALSRNVIASPIERFAYNNIVVEYKYSVAGISKFRRYASLSKLLLELPFIITPLFRWVANLKYYFITAIFNRRPAEARERYELLKFIVAHKAISNAPFTLHELMAEMYGFLYFSQNDRNWHAQKIKYQLASLVETKDLEESGHNAYKVAGLAWKSLSDFQEENRRHRDSARMQFIILLLTLVIAFFAIAHSGIIRLPVLLDLRTSNPAPLKSISLPLSSLMLPDASSHQAIDSILMQKPEALGMEHATNIEQHQLQNADDDRSKSQSKIKQ